MLGKPSNYDSKSKQEETDSFDYAKNKHGKGCSVKNTIDKVERQMT